MSHRLIDTGLNELKEKLALMAEDVEEAIHAAIEAFKNRNPLFIETVMGIEDRVNAAHKDVDATCFKILATQSPLAHDLRVVLSILKINSDLERMVDQAVNIVRNTEYYLKHPQPNELSDLSQMSIEVRAMVRQAIESFLNSDSDQAETVLLADDKVDRFKDKIFTDTSEEIQRRPKHTEQGLAMILIARNLERIGDHATNIAEDVVFSVLGKDIRHPKLKRQPRK